jgi:hypothetical protein
MLWIVVNQHSRSTFTSGAAQNCCAPAATVRLKTILPDSIMTVRDLHRQQNQRNRETPNGNQSTRPLLIIANTGHYFIRPDEILYENAFSTDKMIAYSEGAVHGGGPCAACTRIILNNPTLSNAVANAYWTDPAGTGPAERSWDVIAEWLSARY